MLSSKGGHVFADVALLGYGKPLHAVLPFIRERFPNACIHAVQTSEDSPNHHEFARAFSRFNVTRVPCGRPVSVDIAVMCDPSLRFGDFSPITSVSWRHLLYPEDLLDLFFPGEEAVPCVREYIYALREDRK